MLTWVEYSSGVVCPFLRAAVSNNPQCTEAGIVLESPTPIKYQDAPMNRCYWWIMSSLALNNSIKTDGNSATAIKTQLKLED